MRRIETYVGQQVYEWSFSAQAQYTMTAIAKVCSALLGTSGTVNGLACTPTSPATMTVQIGAGELYQVANLEATACGTLPADTTHTILKQGIQLGTYTTSTFAAPTTSGQSINYLIEAQYQDSDISLDPTTGTTPVVLQFYNSTTPSSPWSGPNNSGATSNTFRDGVVAYQIKAGVAATTGSQVTPSPDTGWIGLWVVTVPYGATSLTSSNISQYTGSPILPTSLLQSLLTSNLKYGVDSGTANTIQAKFPIPVTALTDNMDVWVKIAATNTGATTFTPNPGVIAASPVVGAAHAALQGAELVANGRANFVWRADITSWVLVECTGGALQVAPATASQHAVQLGQLGVVGQCRLSVSSSSALLLSPYNGNMLTVNGSIVQIPSAGLSLANTGLIGPVSVSSYSLTSNVMTLTTSSAHGLAVGSRVYIENEALGANGSYVVTAVGSTTTFSFAFTASNASGSESGCTCQPTYYIYVNSTPALVASQVGYTVQSNGVATQTGNTALTLVGMFMVNASGFIDSDAYRWCVNWFNRRPRRAAVASTATGTYSSTTAYGEVSSVYRTRFLMWADDSPQLIFTGTITGPATASSINYVAAIDSPGNGMTPATLQTTGSSYSSTMAGVGLVDATVSATLTPNEGGHCSMLTAKVGANGGTFTINSIQTNVSVFG